jgi:hypothetical protein
VSQWIGYAKTSMTTDTYGHVMVGDEVPEATLRGLLDADDAVPVGGRVRAQVEPVEAVSLNGANKSAIHG